MSDHVEINGRLIGKDEWEGLPDLTDLLAHGGHPGVRYCLAPAEKIGEMRRSPIPGASEQELWWMVPGLEPFTVHGPGGSCDTVVLMAQGQPIVGASPLNGRRHYFCHRVLMIQLGYEGNESEESAAAAREQLRVETAAHKAKASGAARRAVEGTAPTSPGGTEWTRDNMPRDNMQATTAIPQMPQLPKET